MKQFLLFVLLITFAHYSQASVMVTGSFDKSAGKVFSALSVAEARHEKVVQSNNDIFSCARTARAKYTCSFAISKAYAELDNLSGGKAVKFNGEIAAEIYDALFVPTVHAGMGRTMKGIGAITCWRNARPGQPLVIGCRIEGLN